MRSPAKLNLGLRIVGRRPDGYHLIESVFWPLDFVDDMELGPASDLSVEASWAKEAPRPNPGLPQQRENLAYRAAERALGPRAGLGIHIRKRIPMGAGLGGGSSNAGSLLGHLLRQNEISAADAESMALGIGADVPFFLTPRPSWVEGIGETRRALKVSAEVLDNLTFLLIIPPLATPTPIIFSKYRALGVPFAPATKLSTENLDWARLRKYLARAENSLQGIAAMEYPVVAEILAQLKKTPSLYSGLSGTGSTCFAAFQEPGIAAKISKDLQSFCRKRDCQSITARTYRE